MTGQRSDGPHHTVRLLIALLLFLATPVGAQTRLYILFAGDASWSCPSGVCQPGRVLDIDIDGRQLLADVPVAHARESPTAPVVTPDGRYLAWMGFESRSRVPSCVSVLDTATRSEAPLLCAGTDWIGGTLLADPAALRLYAHLFNMPGSATVIEPQGTRTLRLPCGNAIFGDISADGTRLSATCVVGLGLVQTHVLDAARGQPVGMLTGPVMVEMDTNGTHLFSAENRRGSLDLEVSRYDVSTGQPTGSRTLWNAAMHGSAVHDARTGWLAIGTFERASGTTGLHVFDGTTLADVGHLPAPLPEAFPFVVFDPDRAAMYVLWHAPSAAGVWRNRLAVYETAGFTLVAEAELGFTRAPAGMVLGPRPPRAFALTATVSGDVVTLQWTNEVRNAMATGLVVEAGSEPGLANLARLSVAAGETSLSVPNVPSGTYYVRVRSMNGTGLGDPSNEVLVSVP